MTKHVVAATVFLLVPLVAAAQRDRPTLDTTLDPVVISVGDPVTVVVTVGHAPDQDVVWPDPVAVDPFELLDVRQAESAPEGNLVRSRLELTVTAFELGELSLPTFEVQVVDATGDTVTLSTDSATVTIESVGRDDGGEIRDIKGPLAVPFGVVSLLPWLAGLAGLAAAVWLYRRYQRRTRPEVPAPSVPPRPAHEVAYESLDALAASGLLELGEVKTFHIRVSDIMRVYVEGQCGVEAMEMTTGEVLEGLRRTSAGSGVVADFSQLLERCDLVKFAKLRPGVSDCRELVPLGRRLVDRTKPATPAPIDAPAEAIVA